MARKKSKTNNYFDSSVNDAIIQFKETESSFEREKLFTTKIYPALNKLVENIIHKWKFYNYETSYSDLKADTVSYLYEKLKKYDPSTGSKAFSYFTIVARNFLIGNAKNYNIHINAKHDLDVVDNQRNVMIEISQDNYLDNVSLFLKNWCEFVTNNITDIFKTKRDQNIALAFVNVLDSNYELDISNKKQIYIFIKEQTGLSSSTHITNVMKHIKESLRLNMRVFDKYGKIFSFEGKEVMHEKSI